MDIILENWLHIISLIYLICHVGSNISVDKDNTTANRESSVTTKNKEIIIGIVIAIVIIGAIGGIGYYIYSKKKIRNNN